MHEVDNEHAQAVEAERPKKLKESILHVIEVRSPARDN